VSKVPDDPICTCEDRAWLAQVFIDGALVDEALVDTGLDHATVANTMIDVRDRHHMIVNIAIAAGKHWRVLCICPNCKKGMEFDSKKGTEVLLGEN
jgi:hypothetical protein